MLASIGIAAALSVLAPATAARDAGPVVLLGEQASCAQVPELAPLREGSGADVLLLAGSPDSPVPVDARAWCGHEDSVLLRLAPGLDLERRQLELLRGARRIALGPGSAREWLEALRRGGKPSAALVAVHEAWSAGAVVVGRGDTSALLSVAFVVSGPDELGWDTREPHRAGAPCGARGLGFQPFALVDTAGRSDGRLERLVGRLVDGDHDLGLWLAPTSVVVVAPRATALRIRGEEPVLLVDARGARRSRDALRGARWSVLPPGCTWDPRQRRPGGEHEPAGPGGAVRTARLQDALDARALLAALAVSADAPRPSAWVLTDGSRRLRLEVDEDSAWLRSAAGAVRVPALLRGELEP